MWKKYPKKKFIIWLNRQGLAIVFMLALVASSFGAGTTVHAEKSNYQMAQELIYGNWVRPFATQLTYEFNEKNIKILQVSNVNPMGESTIVVSLKKPDGSWTKNNIICYASLEDSRYRMQLVRKNERGNEIKGNDAGVKYMKVYWNGND